MKIVTGGTLKGSILELDDRLKLPQGVHVHVTLEPEAFSLEQKRQLATELGGCWADDEDIPAIFDQIENERHHNAPRPVELP